MQRANWGVTELRCEICGCTESNACLVEDPEDGSIHGCAWDVGAAGPRTTCSACSGAHSRLRGPNR